MSTTNDLVGRLVADLEQNPPANLGEARDKLRDLIAALRRSVEEMLAAAQPDYAAIQDRVAVIEAFVVAVHDLEKADAAATAAFERTWKKLRGERNEQRIWRKLRPLGEKKQ